VTNSLRLIPALVAAAVALVACAGTQQTFYACPAVVPAPIAWTMTSPANGATNVPVTVGTIVVPGGADAPTGARVLLTPSGGATAVQGGIFVAQTNGTDTASIPRLAAGTAYTVTASATSAGRCPVTTTWNIGSFTTQ
jgi:hypothetical protein